MRSNGCNYKYGFLNMFTEKCIVLLYSSIIDDFYKAMYFVDITSREQGTLRMMIENQF